MKLTTLISVLAVTIAFPQGVAMANTPEESSSGGSPRLSTSSSDLFNQNQESVTNNNTTQASTGVVQQSANYNIGQAATYDFRGIAGTRAYCPTPALLFSGSSSFGHRGASSHSLSTALVVPLGGKAARNCTKISTQILKEQEQYLLNTSFNNQFQVASRCTSLLKSGVSINAEIFPELAQFCQGISLGQGGGDLSPEPATLPEPKAPPVIVPPPPPAVRGSY